MIEKVQAYFFDKCHLDPKEETLVGVSGGTDSLFLFDFLQRAGFRVIVAHFNHRLRIDAGADAEMVSRLAEKRQVKFILGEGDVLGFARQNKISVEEAARILRYQFLFAQAHHDKAQAVAVAHTADDQVETVLMHLLRGAGHDGLAGMRAYLLPNPWSTTIPLVRPLIEVWRNEIEAYCLENGLEPVEDRTNQDIKYTRNRIRHDLIPQLGKYNPRIKKAIFRMSQSVQADLEVLEKETNTAWQVCMAESGDGFIAFHLDKFNTLPLGLQRRLLRKASTFLGRQDVDFDMVDHGAFAIKHSPGQHRLDFGKGLCLYWEGNRVWLAEWKAELPTHNWPQLDISERDIVPVDVPTKVSLLDGWQLSAEELPGEIAWSLAQSNLDLFQAFLQVPVQSGDLNLRTRRPGDIFQPFGLDEHTQKISDLMVNKKIPQRARRKWPLICAGDTVIWVPGCGISHAARLYPGVKTAVHLRIKQVNPSQVLQP